MLQRVNNTSLILLIL